MAKYDPQNKYNEKQTQKGYMRVTVWVPVALKPELVAYAKRLRKGS